MNRTNLYRVTIVVLMVLVVISFRYALKYESIIKRLNSLKPVGETEEPDLAYHIIPHRGASGEEKEHSIAAYDLACDYGAKYLEQDLVFSGEGTLYVAHDLWMTKGQYGIRFQDADDATIDENQFLKLSDVIARYKDKGITFVIEIRAKNNDSFDGKSQLDVLIEMLKEYNDETLNEHIIVQAWDEESLKQVKEYDENIRTMYLTSDVEGLDEAVASKYVDIVCTEMSLASVVTSKRIHKAGKLACGYTYNTTEEIELAIGSGLDMYFTNYVAKALAMEKKFR